MQDGKLRRYDILGDQAYLKSREKIEALTEAYQNEVSIENRARIKRKIAELSRRMLECKKVWEQYAPP